MAVCARCGTVLPAPRGTLDKYTPNGLIWLAIVILTVSVMAIGAAAAMTASLLESELPYTWKLALALAFGAVMVLVLILSMRRVFKARRLSHYCSDCAAMLAVEKMSHPEVSGAHKIRTKKE